MDIYAINEAIATLENSETTLENISDLANLYIVKNSLQSSTENELNDILPAYAEYIHIKKQYQMHEISEGAVIKSLKYVCVEIREFLHALYQCTDMGRERKCIRDMINTLYSDFEEK